MDWPSKDTLTAIAATVAAFTSAWTWFQGFKSDQILVVLGDKFDPGLEKREGVTIENRGKNKVHLLDWGLIFDDGKLFSLREHDALCGSHDQGQRMRGFSDGLEPHAVFVHTILAQPKLYGGYAITNAQSFRRIRFASSVPLKRKLQLWWRYVVPK